MIYLEKTANGGLQHVVTNTKPTPADVKNKTAALLESVRKDQPDLMGGRVVTGMYLRPRAPDGSGGTVVKTIRTGGPASMATFAETVPYFRLSEAKRAELEAEVAAIDAKLASPGLDLITRDKLKQDRQKVADLLAMDRNSPPDRSSSLPGRGYDRATR